MILTAASFLNAFAQNNAATAETMFQTKSLTLPPNIKHLVILLPNEAHESQHTGHPSSDQRLIYRSTHSYNDIRAGDQQALLVWTTSGMNLDEIISALQEITPGLPYS